MRTSPILAGTLLIALTAAPGRTPVADGPASPQAACGSLQGVGIAAAQIGLPTRGAVVTSARLLPATAPEGEHCRVLGRIESVDPQAPDIYFQLNLPSDWNGKAVHFGGGGYNGTVVNGLAARYAPPGSPSPVRQGYATFGSDSGHEGSAADASFALNDEALRNWGGDQLKKTRDVAAQLIARRYGEAPRSTYFQGSSQGGHEAFIVMQRWPEDYDGVVAVHPVYNLAALQLAGVRLGQALYGTPGAWLDPQAVSLIHETSLQRCDGLDGASDGIIGDVAGCAAAFDPATLRCPDDDAGAHCLSDAQLGAVQAFTSRTRLGVTLQAGIDSFAAWPLLTGGELRGRFSLGSSPRPARPPAPPEAAFIYVMGDQFVRYMVLREPSADSLKFEPARHRARLQTVSELVDANRVGVEAFRRRGGKLLLWHGTADMAVPVGNTIDYYERLRQRFGPDGVREFVRFYVVPGFGHGDGPFVMAWDSLGALDAWVESGRPPVDPVAIDTARATAGRSRPLCEYPAWPKYRGSGDVNAAASFVCTSE